MNSDLFYIKLAEAFSWLSTNLTLTLVGKVFALLLIIWMVLSFLKAHRDPKSPVDLTDLLVDGSGKIGGSKMRLNLAFVVCTWVLIYYSLNGQLSEWLFAAYLGAFVFDRMKSRDAGSNGDDSAPAPAPVTPTVAAAISAAPAAPATAPTTAPKAVAPASSDQDDPDFVPQNLPEPPAPK